MAKQRLMTAMDTKQMLVMLYPDLKVTECDAPVEQGENAIFGTYIDDDDVPVSLCAVDWAFAANMGSALTMVPPQTAAAAAESGQFSDVVMGNMREVFNILSRVYMDGSSPHLRFAEVRMSRGELAPSELPVIEGCAARLDMEFTVPDYGSGKCSLITL